ncbi:MAG: iron uptake system protein EfeO, partial [Tepidiformaceae bacterium]
MLPTFVIGLREGLEAALIVGIVAAFLRQRGRTDALRWVWIGVLGAVGLCAAAGVALKIASNELPQKQQEGLETVVGAVAVVMVSYMAVWMRRNSHNLKSQLEGVASGALAEGSAWALVGMAFFAVLREGLETAVFLLAAFDASGNAGASGIGATLGVLAAVALGYGIYRGGVKINLNRFFLATGMVLVLVAAGLVMTALHTAHEAGWLNAGQQQLLDLSWLVQPGTVLASVLTGVIGLQPFPTTIEVAGWLLYFVPLTAYLLWPALHRSKATGAGGGGGGARHESELAPAADARLGAGVLQTVRRSPSKLSARKLSAPRLSAVLLLTALGATVFAGCRGDDNSAAQTATNTQTVNVTLTNDACTPDSTSLKTGPTVFKVQNKGGSAVSEVELMQGSQILGEKENLAPGFSGSFSLELKPGSYSLYCPGAKTDKTQVTVSGDAPAASGSAQEHAALTKAVTDYKAYVQQQVAQLVTNAQALSAAIDAGDLDAAKAAYGPGRLNYERIEPVAESFGDLDLHIDGRLNDFDAPADFQGYHKIEQALWETGSTQGMEPVAKQLVADVQSLQKLVATLDITPAQMANGATELLNEVANGKITGEEERYSH